MKLIYDDITEKIIFAAFEVHNCLGYGFLEKVYQRSMQAELVRLGLRAEMEYALKIYYKGIMVGEYFADLLVESKVIIEFKVSKRYNPSDEAQVLNQLKASGMKVGLLINFGRYKVEFKRFVY